MVSGGVQEGALHLPDRLPGRYVPGGGSGGCLLGPLPGPRKAFDTMNFEILLKLTKYGGRCSAVSWTRSYLSGRSQVMRIWSKRSARSLSRVASCRGQSSVHYYFQFILMTCCIISLLKQIFMPMIWPSRFLLLLVMNYSQNLINVFHH